MPEYPYRIERVWVTTVFNELGQHESNTTGEQIVRCKDCVHCTFTEVSKGRFVWRWCDFIRHTVYRDGMGFCAWGERKNDA